MARTGIGGTARARLVYLSRMRKALFLLVLLVGCGGGGGGDDDDDAPDAAAPDSAVPDGHASDLTVSEAFDESVRITCEKAFDCRDSFPGQPADFAAAFGNSVEECRTMLAADSPVADYVASVEAGRIIYNPDNAATCLDSFEGLACDMFWDGGVSDPTCDATFVGQVPDGQACTMDDDCATDTAFCDTTCMP